MSSVGVREDSSKVGKSWSRSFWVEVGEARTDITEMALERETWELNATTAC